MNTAAEGAKGKKSLAKWLAAAAVASVPLAGVAVGATVPSAYAAEFELLPPGPARVLTLSLIPRGNDDDLQGVMCEAPRTCQQVVYSYLRRSVGVTNINNALGDGTTGRQIVFAYSEGARAASLWLEENAGQEGAPSPEQLSFVLMGNPTRKYGGADRNYDTMPETDYKVLDVSREYDAASDFPDNPFNLLAMLNTSAGFMFTHQDYEEVDIYSPANYVWTEGNTTYVFVPTEHLPLLRPLRLLGLTALADALNGPLKEIVDRAYDRYYLPDAPGLPAPEPEPEPEPEAALMATSTQRSALTAEAGVADESLPTDEEESSDVIDVDAAVEIDDVVEEPAADTDSEQSVDEAVDENADVDVEPSTEADSEPESSEDDEPSRKVSRSKASSDDSPSKSSSQDSQSSSGSESTDSASKDSGNSDE